MEKQTFHANGKLLITGEYLVMQGALALAVPTKLGQEMHLRIGTRENGITGMREGILEWRSFFGEECWFEGSFSLPELDILHSTDDGKARYIQKLMIEADKCNPAILKEADPILVETLLDFNPEWGLGSSSSLISMLADWFSIDPYQLFRNTQQGSAYDIACARTNHPLWYRLVLGSPIKQQLIFNPEYKDKIAFVYSGKKQDSAAAITSYMQSEKADATARGRISQIARDISSAANLKEFNALLDEHEDIMSGILKAPKVKTHFPNFPGSIKSLGAWGGDFILASSEIGFVGIKSYFSNKGLDVVFSFDELIRSE